MAEELGFLVRDRVGQELDDDPVDFQVHNELAHAQVRVQAVGLSSLPDLPLMNRPIHRSAVATWASQTHPMGGARDVGRTACSRQPRARGGRAGGRTTRRPRRRPSPRRTGAS
eukprot:2574718-Heterocapsa_arctica.AAC.1